MQGPKSNGSGSIVSSAILIAAGTFSSRILGFVRDHLFFAYFDKTVTDAWVAAFRLPNMFRRLLGEGSLSVSFIPIFLDTLKADSNDPKGRSQQSQQLVNVVFTVLLVVLSALTALGILFAEPIVKFVVSGEGFTSIPGKLELTIRMAKIMFVYILLVCLYAYFMAILNGLKKFGMAAFAPALWNVAMIISCLLPQNILPFPGDFLALGVVVGGVLQLILLVPGLIKTGFFPRLTTDWKSTNASLVFKNMLPSMLGLGILQTTIIINTHFASRLPEGAASWIYLADRVLELPLSLFAVSLGMALLPTISKHWSDGHLKAMSEITLDNLRLILFVSVPAAVGTFFLSYPIVDVLFRAGKFSSQDVEQTAMILKIYSSAIVSYGLVRILAPSFYAIKNTWYPAVVSAICLVQHFLCASYFIEIWGINGLIVSTILSAVSNLLGLSLGYKKFIGALGWSRLFSPFIKNLLAASSIYLVHFLYFYALDFWGQGREVKIPALFLTISTSIVSYFLLSKLLKVKESEVIWNRIALKIKRFN
jgi:putative peptidoglycan lipid II flippase